MKALFTGAAAAAMMMAGSASAAVVITAGTVGDIDPNATIYADYDTVNPAPSGGLLETTGQAGIPGVAAPVGSGNFAYTTGGSNVSYSLDRSARALSLDAGSIDGYNYINLDFADGTSQAIGFDSAQFLASGASGNSRLTFTSSGAKISGFTLGSGFNSFEFDNLALGGVPEPATWAMLILGFGLVGGALRRRRATATAFA